jgi:Domain of unknown function (DUF4160)
LVDDTFALKGGTRSTPSCATCRGSRPISISCLQTPAAVEALARLAGGCYIQAMPEGLKLNPPIDIAAVPRPGTVTAVSSGTAAVVPLDWPEEINAAGIQPGQLGSLLDAMAQLAAEEEEITADMVSYRKNVTGLDNTVFISVTFPRHGPRIKVAIDPPTHVDPMGNNASVSIDDGSVVDGHLSARELAQVRRFIDINRDVLPDYWEKRIDTDELRDRLRKV